MGDDGIGPFVVRILESRYEFPPNVVLHNLAISFRTGNGFDQWLRWLNALQL
ncbi:MAG: hypothetical protein WAM58_10180 [Candidatus Acidiferrum sp.]